MISIEKYSRHKRIEAVILGIVALAIFISLFVVLTKRPFSRPKLTDDEKTIVLELQNKMASNKSIEVADAVNADITIDSSYDGLKKVTYQFRALETHYEVVTEFDSNFNIIESDIYNANTFHTALYVVYAFLGLGGSFALAFVSLSMYDKYY